MRTHPLRAPIIVSLLALVLAGAGCASSHLPTSNSAPASASPAPTVSADLTDVTSTQQNGDEKNGTCKVSAVYPSVAVAGLSDVAQASINQAVQNSVITLLGEADHAPASVDAAVKLGLTDCQSWQVADAEMGVPQDLWNEVTYGVDDNSNGLLSLDFTDSVNSGGAHPNSTRDFLTFDLNTGKQLALADFVAPSNVLGFVKLEQQALLTSRGSELFADDQTATQEFLAKPTDAAAQSMFQAMDFSVTPTAIIIHYALYDIAPYVSGFIDVPLSYASLGPLVSQP